MINAKIDQRLVRQPTPGPRSYPWVGFLPQVISDPLKTLTSAALRYGGVVCLGSYLPGRQVLLISSPEALKYMLQERARSYTLANAFIADRGVRVLGKGLLLLTGESWLQRRRLLQPAFRRDHYAQYASTITHKTAAAIEQWRSPATHGGVLDIAVEMSKIVRDINSKIMFGFDITSDSNEKIEIVQALKIADSYLTLLDMAHFIPHWAPTTRNQAFKQANRTFDQVVDRLISERRRNTVKQSDLLSLLMEARDQDTGVGLSDQELHDEVRTQFIAGVMTMPNSLAWTWYLLSQHPEIERRFQAEASDVIGERLPTIDDLHKLVYTQMVVMESLRLYPSVWLLPRTLQADEDDEINGHRITKKTLLFYSPYVTHRLPELWEKPEVFDPGRFTQERVAKLPPFTYIPFGGGPRQCIGNNLSLMMISLILATVAQRYSLRLAPGARVEPEPATLLRPRNGIPMTLHPRRK